MDLAIYRIGPCTEMDILYRKRYVPKKTVRSTPVTLAIAVSIPSEWKSNVAFILAKSAVLLYSSNGM